jgi:uncharacterized metal-binding protein YceD (DUF177 family)
MTRLVPAHRPALHRIEARPDELPAIAKRLMLPAVLSLACDYTLTPIGAGAARAEGALRARVVQLDVDTMEPFEADIAEDFAVRFVPEGRETRELDLDAEDEIPFGGETVDLGEATVEQLALALDPYPRAAPPAG